MIEIRRFDVILCLILAISMIPFMPVYADESGELVISTVEGKPGDEVKIEIRIDKNPGITVMKLSVEYDDKLTLVNVADSGLLGSKNHGSDLGSNPFVLYWNNNTKTENITDTGIIAELTFKIADDAAPGNYKVDIKDKDRLKYNILNADAGSVNFDIKDGMVTVSGSVSAPQQGSGADQGNGDIALPEIPASNPTPAPLPPANNPQPAPPALPAAPDTPNAAAETPESPSAADEWDNPFTDVKESDDFFDAIKYVYNNRLFIGVSDTEFAPEMTMTRAMFVTVLGRLDKVDVSGYTETTFIDVIEGEWYATYVEWASEKGIVLGYGDDIFGVNDLITIEQAAVIMARYAEFKGRSAESTEGIDRYMDASDTHEWAKVSLGWAVENGLYEAADGYLKPTAPASRAVVAGMIYGYTSIK